MRFEQPAVPFTLVFVTTGAVDLSIDDEQMTVGEDSYLAVPPGSQLRVNTVRPATGSALVTWFVAFFNPVFVRNVWGSDEPHFHPLPRLYSADELYRHFHRQVRGYLTAPKDTSVGDEEIEDLYLVVIRELATRDEQDRIRWRRLAQRDERDGRRLLAQLNRARDMADNEFARPITVDQLAERAAISKYHFIRLFERAFGLTPHRYLLRVRLEHARRRLLEGSTSISELRVECGFASLGSFSWAFKQAYGTSPSKFAISKKSDARQIG